MFFVLSKTAAFLALPSNLVLIAAVAGLILLPTRYRRLGRRLLAVCVVLLLLFGVTPLGIVMTTSLEQRFPAYDMTGPAPDGIIVLGGGIDPDATAALGEPVIGAAFQRLITARRLAEAYPAARVVYSGGNGNLVPGAGREADVALHAGADPCRARSALAAGDVARAYAARDGVLPAGRHPGDRRAGGAARAVAVALAVAVARRRTRAARRCRA